MTSTKRARGKLVIPYELGTSTVTFAPLGQRGTSLDPDMRQADRADNPIGSNN
jgi:hypothetical protein